MQRRPLAGRVAVVTGVSRRRGIGFAVAQRLLADGAAVLIHSWGAHDDAQPWGPDPGGIPAVLAALGPSSCLAHLESDLARTTTPAEVMADAVDTFGHVDILVATHARSSEQDLEHVTATELDTSWAVNVRATVLLVQALAGQHDDDRPGGRVVLFTSGQHLAPMPSELPYAASKGAVHQMTASLADHLADRQITVNAVNPGPTETGYAAPEVIEQARSSFPTGRWGQPADAGRLVAWLVSDEASWVTGQVINSEGGVRRWR